jgi:hypothetical protein
VAFTLVSPRYMTTAVGFELSRVPQRVAQFVCPAFTDILSVPVWSPVSGDTR